MTGDVGQATHASWSGHVVVCGLHEVGLRVVEQLRAIDVTVLVVDEDPDSRLVPLLAALQVPLVRRDARDAETLAAVGASSAQAVVCAEDDDLRTLATALAVRRLDTAVRVVAQLGNQAVGRALRDVDVQVLDVAAVAAPDIVGACLRTGEHRVPLGDGRPGRDVEEVVVAEATVPVAGTLRSVFGDLAPIAVVGADGEVEIAPGRDHRVEPGERAVVAGTVQELAAHQVGPEAIPVHQEYVGARAYREKESRPTAAALYLIRTMDRRLKRVLLALALLVVCSTTVLRFGYAEASGRRMSVLDGLYFTVETIGTVGYGDFYFRDQPTWLRLWAIGLMLVGATLATVFFALLTNVLISQTLERRLGGRKVTGLSDHVLVIGLGSVGVTVVEGLRAAGVPVAVVESDPANRFLSRMRQYDVPVVLADATLSETLHQVRIDKARAVAVTTSDDLANIETGLAVRDLLGASWADVPVVLRLFDRRLAETVEDSFDFRYVRSTAALAAPWFVGAALGLDVLGTFYAGDQPLLVARLRVPADSVLAGRTMDQLAAQVRVLGLERADGTVVRNPRRDERIEEGDRASLVGAYEELLRLLGADAARDAVGWSARP